MHGIVGTTQPDDWRYTNTYPNNVHAAASAASSATSNDVGASCPEPLSPL
jgi:hypothetical protein